MAATNSYVSKGLFLSKRRYTMTDEKTKEVKDITCTDVLVYDDIEKEGYSSPRVVRVTKPTGEDNGLLPELLGEVYVKFSLSYDRKSGNYKPKPVDVVDDLSEINNDDLPF